MLAVVQTHPVQYHAPVYRALQQRWDVPVTAIYGSDFSVAGYHDAAFDSTFAWDTDLLSGYSAMFLSRTGAGGARNFSEVSARGLGKALRQVQPTAVLVGGYSPAFHRSALGHTWRMGIPILFRAETTTLRAGASAGYWLQDLALRALYSQCTRLLYIGRLSKEHYEQHRVSAEKLVFSPYCVDADSFDAGEDARERLRGSLRLEMGISSETFVILVSGSLIPRKRPHLVLDAVSELRRPGRSLAVVFLGDGELRATLEAKSREMGDVRVHFAGFKNQRALSAYYHAADLLVLASQFETWGLVVNEALCHGLPCVTSDRVSSAADLIRPGITGETFQGGDPRDVAAAIQRAWALTGREEVRSTCRALAADYSVEEAAKGIADAYRTVGKPRGDH
jgi:glycosyltransferase involved in cell wall biosynthesis